MNEERVVRRLAAILAVDVAGYSRLMGADEEGTLRNLKAHRSALLDPSVAEHRGRIVKTTGDGLLAEFQSVVDAVRCAVEVQRGMAERNAASPEGERIEFRIGINLGDVIIDEGDIFGDGVNIAARLEALAEPGGICLSAAAHEQVRDRLGIMLEDLGEQQVKNIARPVRVYRVAPQPSFPGGIPGPQTRETLAVQAANPPPLPDRPSIAVLPFQNMSGDPDQGYFADGIAEDVITALARYPSLFVIARNSTFTYKGRAVEVRQVGRELGVRYVLEGSLRKSGNRIRITSQLVEAESGKHLWAEHYDRDLADIFGVQDEITEAVTIAIAPAVAAAEQQRAMRRPPESLDAWASFQRGLWHLGKFTPDDSAIAEKFFQQARQLDANFAGAYWGLAKAQIISAAIFQKRNLAETLISANALTRQAAALDTADAEARSWLGHVLFMSGDAEGALPEIERALAMSPNLANAHESLGDTLTWSGRPNEGLAALQSYIRLDPRSPMLAVGLQQIVAAHYFCHEYEAAVAAAKRVMRSYPEYPLPHRWLAAALGQLDRTEEARLALDRAIAMAPASFDLYIRGRAPWWRPKDHAHVLEGLHKAGWQE
jgi:adenylate cyclase